MMDRIAVGVGERKLEADRWWFVVQATAWFSRLTGNRLPIYVRVFLLLLLVIFENGLDVGSFSIREVGMIRTSQ